MRAIDSDYFEKIRHFVNQDSYSNADKKTDYTNLIDCNDYSNEKIKHDIFEHLKNFGHCVLQLNKEIEYTIEDITAFLSSQFGEPMNDRNRKKLAYTQIKSERNPEAYVTSNWTQPMHTDEGHTSIYPEIIGMYCYKPAKLGGVSILVEFERLYLALVEKFGEQIDCLFDKKCLDVFSAYGREFKPLLFRKDENKIGISYSPILGKMYCTDTVFEMYDFITKYLHNPGNQLRFKLAEKQILILDNCRVLHARTAFSPQCDRLLYRYWFSRNDLHG
ncbi:MAG: TauD/TfdA family dioxygenase [Coxiellaceae bacterium]|nr:TauD/TfdA family dioxygenase [Coxiellaceae bacterium]